MFLKSSVSLKQEIKCDKIIDFIRILYTVRYSDGSVETVDKYRLYEEKWKIVYADNVE